MKSRVGLVIQYPWMNRCACASAALARALRRASGMSLRGVPQPGRRRIGRLGCGDEAHPAGGSARRQGAARTAAGARASPHGDVFGRVELRHEVYALHCGPR